MQKYCDKEIILVKNGVFKNNEAKDNFSLIEVQVIQSHKLNYRTCVGYIGKLGLRLDADLIEKVSTQCRDVLFVFVGSYLRGQINQKLIHLFETRENILHIDAVPSAYVYPILNEFDILAIPHSIGKSENGGDPLKLYQYLTRNKPIITSPILGVDEFANEIAICSGAEEWINYINNNAEKKSHSLKGILWQERMNSILNRISNEQRVY